MASPLKDHLGPRTVKVLADGIAAGLPEDYPEALRAVVRVAEDELDEWAAWPLCSFVERHGVDHPTESLEAMETLTIRWSCEFALRPFLDAHLDLTRECLRRWTSHPNEAVRRLASEGTRPLLSWAPRVAALTDDPRIGVVDLLDDWIDSTEPVDERMMAHALQTLVKRGDQRALRLLGLTTNPRIEVIGFSCTPSRIDLGAGIELVAEIDSRSAEEQLLVIDFVIHHVTASGGASPKVFKWKNLRLDAGRTARLSKVRRIEPASTRRYHPGHHRIDLQVSGRTVASTGFMLGSV